MTSGVVKSLDLSFLRAPGVRKRIIAVTFLGALAGVLYTLLAPKWYRSTVTVVPASSQRPSGIASLMGAELGGLAAGLGAVAGGGAEVPRIAAVLQSVAVADAVIAKFDLRARYDQKYQESTRDELWQHCQVKALAKPSLVQLTCEDTDPQFVQALLAYFTDVGNQVFRRVSVSSASEEVRYLEKRVAELRRQADDSAARMREFQEKHQIVDLDAQAKALVSAMATLNGQRIAKQMELGYAQTYSARGEPDALQMESKLRIVEEKLKDLEMSQDSISETVPSRAGRGSGNGIFPAAFKVPQLRAEFEKLYRDRKVAEATLIFSLDRLESARANEARDVSSFQVLDPATAPTRRSRPRGMPSVATGAMVALALAFAWEWWRDRRAGGLRPG